MSQIQLSTPTGETVTVDVAEQPVIQIEDPEVSFRGQDVGDRLFDLTDQLAAFIRGRVGAAALALRPDLDKIGATRATVTFGLKLSMKNGQLTSWISEVGGEGSVAVAIEFARA